MTLFKYITRQDAYFKLNSGNSGETSLNLSNDILNLICSNIGFIAKGQKTKITFRIFKDDFIKAICFIVTKLPLYKSTSNASKRVDYSFSLFLQMFGSVVNFFGENDSTDYSVTLSYRTDGRVYLNELEVDGFNIRNFLVEGNSALSFEIESGILVLRLISDISNYNQKSTIKFQSIEGTSFFAAEPSTPFNKK